GAAPSVLVGTSAGALNVAVLAGLAHARPEEACAELTRRWSDVRLDDVLDVGGTVVGTSAGLTGQVLGLPAVLRALVGLPLRLTSLVDPGRQLETLTRVVDWDRLHDNIARGPVDAVAVATTSVATGGTLVFVECKDSVELPPPDTKRDITYVDTVLTPEHLLASAAVPTLFRPVRIDSPREHAGWYLDGGVRMNTPLKPALALGCDRLGVVATTPEVPSAPPPADPDAIEPDVFAAGALALRILLGGAVTDDLRALLAVNAQARAVSADPHDLVDVWFAGPPADRATDLATLANAVFRRGFRGRRAMRSPGLWALDRAIGGSDADHGELLSFLFFDPTFAEAAIALGAEHAALLPEPVS
ncbi:patatin-like phospholipase family protein, partial [Pseudonocardia sp. KRD291]|uniref:patatin-like phospholipase family protein n=1 Tax=Pseudonocardia sp. KRD291 TaxID=2792007 RepID=UPI001C4A068D